MSCKEFRDSLQLRFGDLPEDPDAVRHAQTCGECRRLLQYETRLRQVASHMKVDAPESLWGRIAMDIRVSDQRNWVSETIVSLWNRPRAIATVAVVLLLALLGLIYLPSITPSKTPQVAESPDDSPLDEVRLMLEVHESSPELVDYLVGFTRGEGVTFLASY